MQVADEDHPQCGDKICQYGEICSKDGNACLTRFEMDVYLAPIPKEGHVKNDSYDYWECQSQTCTYHADQVYTIPKGIRVRENDAYCGGDGIELAKMKDYVCTNRGWVCSSPNGCGECDGEYHWNSCEQVTCSPGEKCHPGDGCEYVGGVDHVFLCEEENCTCGNQKCGKNQICAYGNCYFAGQKRNGFAECTFDSYFEHCGTSDTPEQVIRYLCSKQCPSEIPPEKKEGYEYDTFSLNDCYSVDIGLWTCKNEEGCSCGNEICPKNVACVNGQCALYTASENFEMSQYYFDAHTCATEYPEVLSYRPKVSDHYYIAKLERFPYMRYWACDDSNECICNGEKLPPNTICYREKDGTEYVACPPVEWESYSAQRAPKDITNYICNNNQWMCQKNKCMCGDKTLPKNAHCKDDVIYCDVYEMPSDKTGYACLETDKKWKCTAEKCLCGGMELRPGIDCVHRNNMDYQCCGRACFTQNTASEYDCIHGAWVAKQEVETRHCQNKILPAGSACRLFLVLRDENDVDFREYAECGNEDLFEWDDYRCENNRWKCALKDKPCLCHGKPLPEGSRCIDEKAYCGQNGREDWEGFVCRDGQWVDSNKKADSQIKTEKSDLCFDHPLNKGVTCPDYTAFDYFADIKMSEMESCEHVRGCLCHDKLCPPSGVCTPQGCIDPLTDNPFENKEGYLVSDKLRQCADPKGCVCGNEKIEYRDYCYLDKPYISMKSCVLNKKRTIEENNYTSIACDEGDVNWYNDCRPDPDIDPSQYLTRDCLIDDKAFFSDYSVIHRPVNVCILEEGCSCIHNTCKQGEACYKGQCVSDYPCHDTDWYDEEVSKCRP